MRMRAAADVDDDVLVGVVYDAWRSATSW